MMDQEQYDALVADMEEFLSQWTPEEADELRKVLFGGLDEKVPNSPMDVRNRGWKFDELRDLGNRSVEEK